MVLGSISPGRRPDQAVYLLVGNSEILYEPAATLANKRAVLGLHSLPYLYQFKQNCLLKCLSEKIKLATLYINMSVIE